MSRNLDHAGQKAGQGRHIFTRARRSRKRVETGPLGIHFFGIYVKDRPDTGIQVREGAESLQLIVWVAKHALCVNPLFIFVNLDVEGSASTCTPETGRNRTTRSILFRNLCKRPPRPKYSSGIRSGIITTHHLGRSARILRCFPA